MNEARAAAISFIILATVCSYWTAAASSSCQKFDREFPVEVRDTEDRFVANLTVDVGSFFVFDGRDVVWIRGEIPEVGTSFGIWTVDDATGDGPQIRDVLPPDWETGQYLPVSPEYMMLGYDRGLLLYHARVDEKSLPSTTVRTAVLAHDVETGETWRTPFGAESHVPQDARGNPIKRNATTTWSNVGFVWGSAIVRDDGWGSQREVFVYDARSQSWMIQDLKPKDWAVPTDAKVVDHDNGHLVMAGRYSHPMGYPDWHDEELPPQFGPPGLWLYHPENGTMENITVDGRSSEANIDSGYVYWVDGAGTHRRLLDGGAHEDVPSIDRANLTRLHDGRVYSVDVVLNWFTATSGCGTTSTTGATGPADGNGAGTGEGDGNDGPAEPTTGAGPASVIAVLALLAVVFSLSVRRR